MRINLAPLKPLVGAVPLLLLVAAVAAVVMWPRSPVEQIQEGQWTCSMHPQVRRNGPGQCPICGMDLVPVGQLESLQAQLEERTGVETEAVKRRELVKEIRTVGKIDYNETQVADITARIAGRVDRLYVDFTGIDVQEKDHLVDIYSPELIVAQEELSRALDASERQRPGGAGVADRFRLSNLDSTRSKLRLWGILPEQIAEFEKSRQPLEHVTLYAPMAGTVIEKNIRVGQYVEEGDLLYRIAELDPIWLFLDIYEFDIAWVRYGQNVDVSLEAMPGEAIRGMVTFIDPFLNESTRTVKVRVNLRNEDRRMKPGMYASAVIRVPLNADGSAAPTGLEGKFACPMHPEVIQDDPGDCRICGMDLQQVPQRGPFAYIGQPAVAHTHHDHPGQAEPEQSTSAAAPPHTPAEQASANGDEMSTDLPLAILASAVLDTGQRRIAYRKRDDGAYELVTLTVGTRAVGADDRGERTQYFAVLDGLSENDEVVVRAGFLLDSQRQIEGMPSLFFPEGAAPPAEHSGHEGHGASAPKVKRGPSDMEKMRTELQKLSPEDRASAEAQHFCPVTGSMLGTMGPPQKLVVRDQEVWICCPACKDKLLSDPDRYLAKLRTK